MSDEEFAALPLDQMVSALEEQAARTTEAVLGYEPNTGLQTPEPGPMDMEGGATFDLAEAEAQLDPNIIEAASMAMVQGGVLDMATARVTPELVEAAQVVADMGAPALYDCRNNVADLVEVITGVANGTIPVAPTTPDALGAGQLGPGGETGGANLGPGQPSPAGPGGDLTGGLGSLNLGGGGGSPTGSPTGGGPFGI